MSRRQKIKHYRNIWGELYGYRFRRQLSLDDIRDITEWLHKQNLIIDKDYFTDDNRRRWYFKDQKNIVGLKLIWA